MEKNYNGWNNSNSRSSGPGKAKQENIINVTGCHDCPFVQMDDESGIDYWCMHPTIIGSMNVNGHSENEAIHPSCPLKQQSITVKLEENEK